MIDLLPEDKLVLPALGNIELQLIRSLLRYDGVDYG